MTIIISAMAVVGSIVAFCAGVLWQMDHEEKRLSARVIRPVNITIEKHVHVTEYTISDPASLDIDFPNSRRKAV